MATFVLTNTTSSAVWLRDFYFNLAASGELTLTGRTVSELASMTDLQRLIADGSIRLELTHSADEIAEPQLLDSTLTPWKQSVRMATTVALAANTRTGNLIVADGNGVMADVDGITPAVGDRLLVKNEAAGADNGIYDVIAVGAAAAPFQLRRAPDADTSAKMAGGDTVFVTSGTTNGGTVQRLATSGATLNTTALVFDSVSGSVEGVDGVGANKIARATWDHGAGLTAAGSPYLFGPTLPDNATVLRSWYEVITTFTSATDAAEIGLGIDADASEEIVAAVAISDAGNPWDAGFQDGVQDGTAGNVTTKLTAARQFEGTVATEDTTAGKLILFVEYVVTE